MGAPRVVSISALEVEGIDELLDGILQTHESWTKRVQTRLLNEWLQSVQHSAAHRWPAGLNLKYISQTSTKPPTFTLFYNMQHHKLPTTQRRRLIKMLNQEFGFDSTPVRLLTRKNDQTSRRQR